MEDQGSFNNKAFFSFFRLLITGELDSLIALPEMKEAEAYDWGDENGAEVRLSKRYIKPRNLSLQFLLMADSEADFWERYKLLLAELSAPGLLRLYVDELQRSFYVYYTRQTNAKAVTLFRQGGKVCATFTLEFIEPDPSRFEPYTYLTDSDGNFILTPDGKKILVTT